MTSVALLLRGKTRDALIFLEYAYTEGRPMLREMYRMTEK